MAKFSSADPDAPESKTPFGAPRCQAANSRGERCGKPALKFGDGRCKTHNSAPNNLAAVERRRLDHEARKLLGTWSPSPAPVSDPVGELSRMAGQATALKDMAYLASEPRDACDCCGRGETDPTSLMAFALMAKQLTTMLTSLDKIDLREKIAAHDQRAAMIVLTAMAAATSEVYPEVDEDRVRLQERFRHWVTIFEQNPASVPEVINTKSRPPVASFVFDSDPEYRNDDDRTTYTVPISPATEDDADWLG